MPKWLVIGLVGLMLFTFASTGAAQTPISISELEIDLWPEYDRPSVLVIQHIKLDAATSLPAEVSLRMPAAAGEPFNVAIRETDGMLYLVSYNREVQGDWAYINFTAPVTEIQFEYYDPGLEKNGTQRTFNFTWGSDYAVAALNVQVQQPVDASNMLITPALGTGMPGEGGVVYFNAMVGAVNPGTEFKIALQYDKSTDTLTSTNQTVQSSEPIDSQTTGRSPQINSILPWILGGLGVVFIAGGAFWYFWTGRKVNQKERKRHAGAALQAEAAAGEEVVYCHQCGHRAVPTDRFCRVCGTQLRRGNKA